MRLRVQKKLDIFNFERPIGIQIFGGNEDSMKRAVEIVSDFYFQYEKHKLWMPC